MEPTVVIDWHVHAAEAEFFERYPHYTDTFRDYWEPFVRLYGVDIFKTMNQPLHAKLRLLDEAGVDRAVFIGLDLLPHPGFRIPLEYIAGLQAAHPARVEGLPTWESPPGIDQ